MWEAVVWTLLGLLGMGGLIVWARLRMARECNCVDCSGQLAKWEERKVSATVRLMAGERL